MEANCPRCGTAIPTDRLSICPRCLLDDGSSGDGAPFKAGMKIGDKIELLQEIGRGGMGSVFKARHIPLERHVAVKFLAPEFSSSPEFRERFQREARALAKLSHPNIVSIFDFGEIDGVFYLVMEYVDGGSLFDLIPLKAELAAEHVAELCSAVDYAHRNGIIHRDIKPANVLRDIAGRVKLTDFGIAKSIAPSTVGGVGANLTAPDVVPGTPGYVAPETLRGDAPNAQTDIYSLGVLFYELITAKLPVGSFEPLAAPFDAVLRKALAHDTVKRYATAVAMRQDLVAALATVAPATSTADHTELAPDEYNLVRAAALINSVATSVGLWALLECLRPKYFNAGEVPPLVMPFVKKVDDGTFYSPARFETWPVLGAVMAAVVAFGANALLRRHWRKAGLEVHTPEAPLRQSTRVLWLGLGAVSLYALHKLLEHQGHVWAAIYFPIVGGFVEVVTLFFVWLTILESWRRTRALTREPLLWFGLVLALCPPAYTLYEHLVHNL
jgi:predicted Ser/Thr protein kinase